MSTVIHISEFTSLALHSVAYIASESRAVKAAEIAERTGASEAHLSKVLQWLVKSGLIKSTRGPLGGFVLAKSASKITLLNIFEIMEGPVATSKCPLSRKKCPFNHCMFDGLIAKLNNEFTDYLKNSTLENFIKKDKKGG